MRMKTNFIHFTILLRSDNVSASGVIIDICDGKQNLGIFNPIFPQLAVKLCPLIHLLCSLPLIISFCFPIKKMGNK